MDCHMSENSLSDPLFTAAGTCIRSIVFRAAAKASPQIRWGHFIICKACDSRYIEKRGVDEGSVKRLTSSGQLLIWLGTAEVKGAA